ncbi:J domain-containing protein [Labedella endophytica]|uniref:Molecular chaperone DnaJ n=1 Tax=Labedella endophytica TaxID=1523160 RepID=A0A3S0XXH4_9MICO|nr:DnaJ domain-containing protein [Labedella endophytica]RUQ98110.1 molecular chaperone DnaJ [Labedella endophytica]
MTDSPASASPYDVLGVSPSASADELRKAYRRRLRETHPDTGGDALEFTAVQRAWERVGDAGSRAAYDRGESSHTESTAEGTGWSAPSHRSRADNSRPRARSYGHPGGAAREAYLRLIREWAGRGAEPEDPYDPALVRRAPVEIRRALAEALAEEATARQVSALGMAFTVWHDVHVGGGERKIDHVVLGPTGLYAICSEDFGVPVRIHRGELVPIDVTTDEQPVRSLVRASRELGRSARVKITGVVVVVPDEALDEGLVEIDRMRKPAAFIVTRSRLPQLLRTGPSGVDPIGGNELFDVRTRLQAVVRYEV